MPRESVWTGYSKFSVQQPGISAARLHHVCIIAQGSLLGPCQVGHCPFTRRKQMDLAAERDRSILLYIIIN
jgi:hypothetical protein